jgi:glutathione synthase/RimK-type ligase-like ATP-grasp enzyme
MKKILILYGRSDWKKNKPFEKVMYQFSYEYFYGLAEKNGLKLYRSSYQWYDSKKKIFKYAWERKDGQWKRTRDIHPDLIHDKTKSRLEVHFFKEQLEKHFKIINDPEFTLLADNKLFTSLIFPKHFKRYYKITTASDLKDLAKIIKGNRIVLKPIQGSGGEGVRIVPKKSLGREKISGPVIAQEFIDSSFGIRGLVKGVHDLRLVFINDKLIYSYIRQPKKGSLLANLAQGGSMFIVDPRRLPASIKPLVRDVLDVFHFYHPKIFTIDLIFDKNQNPWIVELNTMPGMYFSDDQKKWMDRMYLEMIHVFKKEVKKKASAKRGHS